MATSAQYVATPKIDSAVTVTAEAITTGLAATNSTVAVAFTAGSSGARIDQINLTATGSATTVAGQIALWICKGDIGKTISSLTSATTTATVTTATAHGLITGDLVTIQGCTPAEFNVKGASITVTSTTAFTYAITSVSSAAANVIGYYASTHVAPQYSLLREVPVTAVLPAAGTSKFNASLCSQYNPELFPIILPAGYSLRASVSTTQTSTGINITAIGGDF